ncbi:MAG: HigA family addiction module antitoxin [candidate division WOR-3 bacterium]
MVNKRKPTHPGEVLLEDVIKPSGLSVAEAAKDLGVSRKALYELINGKTSLSPQMAVRIGEATNTSPESWLNMQITLDLWNAMRNKPANIISFPKKATVGNK